MALNSIFNHKVEVSTSILKVKRSRGRLSTHSNICDGIFFCENSITNTICPSYNSHCQELKPTRQLHVQS